MNDAYEPGLPGQEPSGPSASAGWYPDPATGRQRWWDGTSWGPFAPAPAARSELYPAPPLTPAQEKTWAMWCHLGPLLVGLGLALLTAGVLSLFAFVFPLVVMNTLGGRSPRVRAHAVESLNFQLSMLLYSAVLLVFTLAVAVVTLGVGLVVLIPILLGLGLFATVVMVVASVQASSGGFFRYPLTIRFVR